MLRISEYRNKIVIGIHTGGMNMAKIQIGNEVHAIR